jgi:hypothetical protein
MLVSSRIRLDCEACEKTPTPYPLLALFVIDLGHYQTHDLSRRIDFTPQTLKILQVSHVPYFLVIHASGGR